MDKNYDLSGLIAMCGGDPVFMRDFIILFLNTTPPYMEEIRTAVAASDWKTTGEVLHKIRPTIELFGMRALVPELKLVEAWAKTGENKDAIPSKIDEIIPAIEGALAGLAEEVKKYL